MARGKGITKAEDSVIRLGLQNDKSVAEIADFMGRADASIHKRIKRMKATGEIDQFVADLGQADAEK